MKRYLLALLFLLVATPSKIVARVKTIRVDSPVRGVASYYGKTHEGKKMANGKPFHRAAMTAASRTLKLGTRVRVLNLENGQTVDVEITDRGPFVKGRIMDLSEGAARKINMVGKGLAKIMILPIVDEPQFAVNN